MPNVYDHLTLTGGRDPGWASLFPAQPPADGEPGIWKKLEGQISSSGQIPRPAADVEAHHVAERGRKLWVLKHAASNTYLRLSDEDYFIWSQMDGQRTILQLSIAYMKQYRTLALGRVAGLVDVLRGAEMLEGGRPIQVYGALQTKLAGRGYRAWLGWLMQTFLFREVAVSGFSRVVDAAYRRGVWLFYTRPMLLLYAVLSLAGLGVFLFGPQTSLTMPATTASAISLVAAVLGVLFLHECGHAFTVKYFGRDVNRGGLFLMFGMPGAFVDTTDMWLAPKFARLAVTAAGPLVNLILGGAAALLALAYPEAAGDLGRFAFINYVLILTNLIPFIKLDGYYLLMDAVEIANLRERAIAFVSREVWIKLRRGWASGEWFPRFSRDEAFFVVFGGISGLYTFYFLYFGALFLPARFTIALGKLQAIDFRSLASVGVLASVAFTLAFGAAQLMFTADRLRGLVARLVHAVRNLAGWQSVLLIGGVAFAIAFIPNFLKSQARAVGAAESWAAILPILTLTVAAGLAVHLMTGMSQSPWRGGYAGLALASGGLAVTHGLTLTPWGETLTPWGAAALPGFPLRLGLTLLAIVALSPALRLWLTTLRGDIGGAWLLIGLAFALILSPNPDLFRFGAALLLGGVFLAWQLIHRPLPAPLRPLDITSTETDPARLGVYLGMALAWLMESTLAQTVGILGRASQPRLIEAFNRQAAERGQVIWFNIHGKLTDQTPGTPLERREAYAAVLTGWLETIARAVETQFAADALVGAYFELPLRLQRLAANYLLGSLPWEGAAAWESAAPWETGQGGDRLKLKLGFRHLVEWPLLACERTYGRPLAERLMGEFNRVAALAEWNLWLRANGRLGEDTRGDLPTLIEVFQSALADLLGRMAYYTGIRFVEESVLQAHDTLPWQLREVAAPALLRNSRWARQLYTGEQAGLADFLRHLPAFSGLPPESLARLADRARVEHLEGGRTLHRAGRPLRWARVIRSGRVQLVREEGGSEHVVRILEAGELIGADEIVHGHPADARARTLTPVELVRIPAEAAAQTLRDAPPRPEAALLSRIPLFRELSPDDLLHLADALQRATLLAGETAVRHGEHGRELYLIHKGEFAVTVPDGEGAERSVAHLGPGEFFGEMALLHDEPRTATVRAITEAQVWTLSAGDYAAFLKNSASLQTTIEQVSSRRRMELLTA